LERIVLEYSVKEASSFTPGDVVLYAREKNIYTNNRRVHDAVQRLVRKGVLVKVKRGLYRLVETLDISGVIVISGFAILPKGNLSNSLSSTRS